MRFRGIVVVIGVLAAALTLLLGSGGGIARADLPVTYNFLGGIPDELAHPGGSLPGSNDFGCKPSAAHPEPVVLVHGTGGSQQTNWGTYVPLLKNQGYCVFALTYGAIDGAPWPVSAVGGMKPMESSAAQLATYVDKVLAATGARKVDIVGHSQGTVIPDYYAKFLGGADKIDKYVSLAPLWQGTNVGGAAVLMPLVRGLGLTDAQFPLCQACAQFDPTSPFLTKLRAGGVYLPNITYTNISTRYDELVVPYASGQLPGGANVHNIVVQQGCSVDYTEHAGLAGSRRAAYFVLNALDPAHPKPVPCDRAAPITGSAF
ncbi:esterase/lipase family protein [Gordonia polyisoprenivorans]|uniref:esterase/lipase family protein n=1 Tax=Gordonia polyisoprenivorans TaxID=84595 RepID=UPI000B99E678|nr:alpha/beta fold hydrolase [Gordonia polyisoprenivorans]OZC29296.1 lipase [Gordonia polyisoprenivorans]